MKAKLLLVEGAVWVKGRARCVECETPLGYLLPLEVALYKQGDIFCRECHWDYFSPEVNETGDYPTIFKALV